MGKHETSWLRLKFDWVVWMKCKLCQHFLLQPCIEIKRIYMVAIFLLEQRQMVIFVIQTKGPTYYIYLLSLEIDKDINAHLPVQMNSECTANCPPPTCIRFLCFALKSWSCMVSDFSYIHHDSEHASQPVPAIVITSFSHIRLEPKYHGNLIGTIQGYADQKLGKALSVTVAKWLQKLMRGSIIPTRRIVTTVLLFSRNFDIFDISTHHSHILNLMIYYALFSILVEYWENFHQWILVPYASFFHSVSIPHHHFQGTKCFLQDFCHLLCHHAWVLLGNIVFLSF